MWCHKFRLLLPLVILATVSADESAELFESAVKGICGSASVANVDEACMEKIVVNYFGRFSWCQATRASCFVCNTTQLRTLGKNLFTYKGAKASISLDDFVKVSVALFGITHDITQFCAANTVPNKPYADYWTDISNEAEFKASKLEWLEHAFTAIGSSFNSSQNTKCISNSEIVTESEANSQTTDELWTQRTSLFSVLHVLNNFILDAKCVSLPTQASILNNLYRLLGLTSSADRVTEAAMTKIFKNLGIEPTTTTSSAGGGHAGHNHRRKKRSVSDTSHMRYRRAITMITTNASQCLTIDNMFHVYGIDETLGATSTQFEKLCPALIEQKLSGSCNTKKAVASKPTPAQVYGFGTLAVILISCGAFLGGVLVPCMQHSKFDLVMLFFIAMAIGTLVADSFLHLIPAAVGLHNHEAETATGFTPPQPYFWKLFVFILTIYVLYLFELGTAYVQKQTQITNENGYSNHGHSHFPMESTAAKSEVDAEADGKDDIVKSTEDLVPSKKVENSKLTALIVLSGDFIHNFADGLAIGAAFASGLSGGLSTSVAILCHELPHEIGDFMVLISAKISVKRALLLNFLTALSAVVGLYIGISVSSNEAVRGWIFAITAAIFLYIALVDMVPSIKSVCPGSRLVSFTIQAAGLGLGILLVFLLGLFESQIRF